MPSRLPGGAVLVQDHGVLLQSAKGPIPNLAELVVGEAIKGSWWGHPRSHEIFAVINEARDSEDVVALRLVRGKVTLVHRRLWPPLVCLADRFPKGSLDALHEEHLPSGRHRTTKTPYPAWVPKEVQRAAERLSVEDAEAMLPAGVVSSAER
jgi:hypothetical protein